MGAPGHSAVHNGHSKTPAPKLTFRFAGSVPSSARRHEGLRLLLEAHVYAADLRRSVWDFAVEIAALRKSGMSRNDLRWLICKGYLEHGRETTVPQEEGRTFRRSKGLAFGRRTCCVLTETGVEFAQAVLSQTRGNLAAAAASDMDSESVRPEVSDGNGSMHRVVEKLVPRWDRQRQELRVGPYLVKQFKVPAANQERILAAFEEDGWPVKIDDPLPPHPEQDPKRRLHDTINSLNRNQKYRVLRFTGDGSGQGIRWSLTLPSPNGDGRIPQPVA